MFCRYPTKQIRFRIRHSKGEVQCPAWSRAGVDKLPASKDMKRRSSNDAVNMCYAVKGTEGVNFSCKPFLRKMKLNPMGIRCY